MNDMMRVKRIPLRPPVSTSEPNIATSEAEVTKRMKGESRWRTSIDSATGISIT